MSGSAKKLLHAAAGTAAASGSTYVEDVFATHLYTGNNANNHEINNGVDLGDKGGLVWFKRRNTAGDNWLVDSERGGTVALRSNSSVANYSQTGAYSFIQSFDDDGFTMGDQGDINNSNSFVSWSFAKQEGFFDIVTWTGNSTAGREISHNLGSTPGMIAVKALGRSENWLVYHANLSDPDTKILGFNLTNGEMNQSTPANLHSVTATKFEVGNDTSCNNNGDSYVAYLWASGNDSASQIFGDDSDEAIIKTGTYNGNGTTDVTVDVGFEPQWLMIKRSSGNDTGNSQANSWNIFDTTRQWTGTGYDQHTLFWNSNEDEDNNSYRGRLTSTGFVMNESNVSNSGSTYVYMAIRRRMKTPEAGTEVFSRLKNTNSSNDTHDAGFNVDVAWIVRQTQNSGNERYMYSRQIGYNRGASLNSDGTFGDTANAFVFSDEQNKFSSIYIDDTTSISYAFKTAPKVFAHHIVYGTGSGAKTHNHALGVTPEMIIMKYISYTGSSFGKDWYVYHSSQGSSEGYLRLNGNSAFGDYSGHFGSVSSTQFTLNQYLNNAATEPTSVQLFATLAGVSKVGSVSHSGSTDVDCGFSSGARWVMVKRYDSTGDWYVWDTARGINSGNDPYFLVNNKDNAETTNTDYIDPLSSGFTLTSNFTSGTYIFLAFS